ncbi:hypothetical protein KC19_VG315100 [Ceratodon purpureus]|uniref:Uncharacterized protein n=1 Tax=Ceratodon purpureus TaxID=3225 RepID=A0A8T0HWA3_CERPU|nr:hypothetical protein KC19_VG315100 [Ceratodon purpureus]
MNKYVLRKGCVCSAQLVTLEVDSSPRRVLTAAGSSPALRNLSRLLLVIRISERVVLAPGRIYVSSMGVHASATAESIKPPGWRIKLGQLKGSLLVYEVTMSECDSDPKKADLLWLLPVVRADCSNDLSAKVHETNLLVCRAMQVAKERRVRKMNVRFGIVWSLQSPLCCDAAIMERIASGSRGQGLITTLPRPLVRLNLCVVCGLLLI